MKADTSNLKHTIIFTSESIIKMRRKFEVIRYIENSVRHNYFYYNTIAIFKKSFFW